MIAVNPRLDGKVAFISGGGGGIGHAACLAFAAAGAKVAVCEIDPARAERTAAAVIAAGGEAIALPTDLREDTQVAAAVAAAVARFGRLDILHNCAGGTDPQDGNITDVGLDVFDRTIGLDLRGTFLCCRHAIPHMIRAGGGAIVNMSSGVWLGGGADMEAYSSAKAAIVGLTNSLARDYGRHRIRVNAVAPGMITTERQRRLWYRDESLVQAGLQRQCTPDPVTEADVAEVVLFLASDAARGITKQLVPVNGGLR